MVETRKEKAVRLFKEGYNCSQAVFAAFADKYGMDEDMALRVASSFGGGIGRMRETCGAACGMFMVAGMETGSTEGSNKEQKAYNYQVVRELADEFKEINGALLCRELLGLDSKNEEEKKILTDTHVPEERTEKYYKKRPCVEMVSSAVDILERRFK